MKGQNVRTYCPCEAVAGPRQRSCTHTQKNSEPTLRGLTTWMDCTATPEEGWRGGVVGKFCRAKGNIAPARQLRFCAEEECSSYKVTQSMCSDQRQRRSQLEIIRIAERTKREMARAKEIVREKVSRAAPESVWVLSQSSSRCVLVLCQRCVCYCCCPWRSVDHSWCNDGTETYIKLAVALPRSTTTTIARGQLRTPEPMRIPVTKVVSLARSRFLAQLLTSLV